MFVLVGEYPGDYDDFYERPTDVLACAESKEELVLYWAKMDRQEQHEYIDFRVEEAPFIGEGKQG